MALIKAIELPDAFELYTDIEGKSLSYLKPISNINIFVGSNNSGKSRFMRILSDQAEYKTQPGDINLDQVNLQINAIFDQLKDALIKNGFNEANGFSQRSIEELKPLPLSLSLNTDSYKKLRDAFTKVA
jgi:hypothetical protein